MPDPTQDVQATPAFATFFNNLLLSRELTGAQAARKLGVAQSQVSRWKRGEGGISLEKLQAIHDVFGTDIEYLKRLAGLRSSSLSTVTINPEIDAIMDADRAALRDEMSGIDSIFWPAILDARRLATKAAAEIVRLASGQPISNAESTDVSNPNQQRRHTDRRPSRVPGRDKASGFVLAGSV